MEVLFVILLTLILFLAMILLLAAKPRFSGKLTGSFIVIAAIGGLLFYGYGFSVTTDSFCLATIRTLLGVCGMYVGKMDLGSISAAPLMSNTWAQVLFWVVHLLALYATASAAITTVGAEALRKLRLWMARRGHLNLIYGVSDETITLGKNILQKKNGSVVFIDSKPDGNNTAAIAKAGCVLRSDNSAIQADANFLKSVGAHRKGRRITLYAMEAAAADNLQYAQRLLQVLEAHGILPEQTNLVIRAHENSAATSLQVLGDDYGYGSVTVIQETGLAARTLIRKYPPCAHITFDEEGLAKEDFEALVIGFGHMGQTVLRHLVMNGQFAGSKFRAAVFAPDCDAVKGHFSRSNAHVLCAYDISFHPCDARSEQMYDYLESRGSRIKYLAVCTGSDKLNDEIAENLTEYLQSIGVQIPAYICSHRGVRKYTPSDRTSEFHSLCTPEVLSMEHMDALAMLVNSQYCHDDSKTPLQHWLRCDYFSRMSCRAMADFIPAMLKIAGKTEEQVLKSGWELSSEQLENLSRTEHERWCAFHYCMGFTPMGEEAYTKRAQIYCRQLAAGEKPLRIGKDMEERTHACLVSWEELDALSERESRITGKPVNYQKVDTENVLMVPQLLRAGHKAEV